MKPVITIKIMYDHRNERYYRVFNKRKDLGIVWNNDDEDWECENSATGTTWGSFNTLEAAIDWLIESHR